MTTDRATLSCRVCRLTQFLPVKDACRRCKNRLLPGPFPVFHRSMKTPMAQIVAEPREDFGQMIRHIRQARQLTQRQLADGVGTTRQYICKIEKSACIPTMSLIVRLAGAFGVSVTDLVPKSSEEAFMFEIRLLLSRLTPLSQQQILLAAESMVNHENV